MAEHHCLHCAIRNAIIDHFDALGHQHGTTTVVDAMELFPALVTLCAETLSAVEDDDTRSRGLARLISEIIEEVNEIRANGTQPEILMPS